MMSEGEKIFCPSLFFRKNYYLHNSRLLLVSRKGENHDKRRISKSNG